MSDEMQETISLQLDAALLEQVAAEEVERETRRAHDNASAEVNLAATRAQRLRMALYALSGENAGLGDANVANNRRRRELIRGGNA